MANAPSPMSRRQALTGLASTGAGGITSNTLCAGPPRKDVLAANCEAPIFSPVGPNASLYGSADGYPIPDVSLARMQGNPWEPRYRVGAFSHLDALYPTRQVNRAVKPWMFTCAPAEAWRQLRGTRVWLPGQPAPNPVACPLVCLAAQPLHL